MYRSKAPPAVRTPVPVILQQYYPSRINRQTDRSLPLSNSTSGLMCHPIDFVEPSFGANLKGTLGASLLGPPISERPGAPKRRPTELGRPLRLLLVIANGSDLFARSEWWHIGRASVKATLMTSIYSQFIQRGDTRVDAACRSLTRRA